MPATDAACTVHGSCCLPSDMRFALTAPCGLLPTLLECRWVDREQGLGVMGAAGARAADHWAQITELVRPAPDTHRLLRLATNSRNQHLLNHADQVGPRDGAGAGGEVGC